ncbi:MAG: helix-turn-helix transcriptional regulator [Clostridia bacterium]|nr:helix-turn-helix transcriptional regulator [Clostridia bacterium]
MSIGEAVKKRILELCDERNITINKLSTICGITQSTLNNIIHREGSKPTISTIKKICDGLEITLIEFFTSKIFDDLEQEIK